MFFFYIFCLTWWYYWWLICWENTFTKSHLYYPRFGRHLVGTVCYFFYVLFPFLTTFSNSFLMFITLRFFSGLSAYATTTSFLIIGRHHITFQLKRWDQYMHPARLSASGYIKFPWAIRVNFIKGIDCRVAKMSLQYISFIIVKIISVGINFGMSWHDNKIFM